MAAPTSWVVRPMMRRRGRPTWMCGRRGTTATIQAGAASQRRRYLDAGAWTPLPGDGVYALESRATDYVGNVESATSSTSVIRGQHGPRAPSSSNLSDGGRR